MQSLTPNGRNLLKEMEPYVKAEPQRLYTTDDIAFIIGYRKAHTVGLILMPLEQLGVVTRFTSAHGAPALYQFNADAFARVVSKEKQQ